MPGSHNHKTHPQSKQIKIEKPSGMESCILRCMLKCLVKCQLCGVAHSSPTRVASFPGPRLQPGVYRALFIFSGSIYNEPNLLDCHSFSMWYLYSGIYF